MEISVLIKATKQKNQPSVMCPLIQNTQKIAVKEKENPPSHVLVLTELLTGVTRVLLASRGALPGCLRAASWQPPAHSMDRGTVTVGTACSDAAGGFSSHTERLGRGGV